MRQIFVSINPKYEPKCFEVIKMLFRCNRKKVVRGDCVLYLQEVNMDVVLSKFQHVYAGNLLQELKDAYAVGRVHVALEKLPADRHHLLQLQHVRRHHQLLNIVHSHADHA